LVEANIVVADVGAAVMCDTDLKLLFRETLSHQIVPDANVSLDDEVHIRHLILFINYQVVRIGLIKFLGLETKTNVVQEFGLKVLIGVEEVTELEDYVVKKVVDKDMSLYLPWTLVEILIVFVHAEEAVLRPVVGEVVVNLANELLVKGSVRESGEQGHPVVELGAFILVTHPLVVVLDDFDERTHDLRKEHNTEENEDDTHEHFSD